MDENVNISALSNSILSSVKAVLPIQEDDTSFDIEIMLHINAAITTLLQLGVIQNSFTVTSKEDTFAELIPGGTEDIVNLVKMYLFYKTKLGFDSSTLSGAMIEVLKESIREAEWRLMVAFNPSDTFE